MAAAEQQDEMSGMTRPDEIDEFTWNAIHTTWKVFDVNGDGHIDAIELITVLQALGANPTAYEINDVLKQADMEDKGGRNVITKPKFFELVFKGEIARLVFGCDHEAEIRDAFKVLDKNGDGFITANELRQVLGDTIGSNEEAEEFIAMGDTNGDGKVDYKEYAVMMCQNSLALRMSSNTS